MTVTTAETTSLWDTMVSLRSRFGFRHSGSGRSTASLVTDGRGFLYVELWRLTGSEPGAVAVPGIRWLARNTAADRVPTDAIPFDDGSVLVVMPGGLVFVDVDGAVREESGPPFRPEVVAPVPDGSRRVLFLGRPAAPDGACTAWTWSDAAHQPSRGTPLPPLLLRGGGWLDHAGNHYVVNPRGGTPAVYDVPTGEIAPLALDPPADGDTAWLTAPRAGAVLLASRYGDTHRLRLHRSGQATAALDAVDGLTGAVTPVALHPAGRWLALQSRDGLRERMFALDTHTGVVRELDEPGGRGVAAVTWTDSAEDPPPLWLFSVGTGVPCRAVRHRGAERTEVPDDTPAGRYSGWAPSVLARFPGAEGDYEGIVCGHQDWRRAREVVLALHGGPAANWSLKFSPLFQLFAEAGVTVLALNPRGSTGYGEQFHRQVVGRWAGPDLADVLATARYVRRERGGGRLGLYGPSYGAFLALVAACAEPELWSRVLAVAPMLSAERLHAEASAPVRAMIDRLGGRTPIDDDLGPRDVLALLPRLRAELMVVHGALDDTIPVNQSRRLVEALTALGREPGVHFHYHEVPGAGHGPLDGSAELHHAAARFLARS